MNLGEYFSGAFTSAGFCALIATIIYWARFKGRDRASATKTTAESIKVLSESYGLRAEAEISISREWEKIAADLQKKIVIERQECAQEMLVMQARHDEQMTAIKGNVLFLKQEIAELKQKLEENQN